MRTTLFLLALLFQVLPCYAQLSITPDPRATSYLFFAGQPPRAVIAAMTVEEKAKFRQIYDLVLKDNPTLDAEGDTLSTQLTDYRKVLIAALVKSEPKVAPLLEASGSRLTSAQSNAIHQAQTKVMQAEPTLQSQWNDLVKKMTAHQQAVDAAMVKLDPTVAQTLAKLSP